MKEVDFNQLNVQNAYRLLIGTIVPRPIAWVSSVSETGVPNLAPFSFFNAVCSNPPSLLFCPVNQPDGKEKDTLINIRKTRQFVVNLVSFELVEKMNLTAQNFPYGVSEFKEASLTEEKSKLIKPPRVAEAMACFECELIQIVDLAPSMPTPAGQGHIVIGKILLARYQDGVFDNDYVDIKKLDPVARLAGSDYCRVRETFSILRK